MEKELKKELESLMSQDGWSPDARWTLELESFIDTHYISRKDIEKMIKEIEEKVEETGFKTISLALLSTLIKRI